MTQSPTVSLEISRQSCTDEPSSRPSSPDLHASIPPPARQNTIHLTPPPPYQPIYTPNHQSVQLAPGETSGHQIWNHQDPRSSSTQSLVPSTDAADGKRKLLLVYIHGFMGTDTSFRSFPAHVHALLTHALAESHVVHSKIYPRYKSRGAMEFARDDFSKWISPHESETTDIILLGHSLGGILATEVALMPSEAGSSEIFKHRILGIVNFDVPFLGLHPSVISTGIKSLFHPKAKPPSPPKTNDISQADSTESLASTLTSIIPPDSPLSPFHFPTNDPNFNPDFPNDIRLPKRSQLDSAIHFITKHSSHLARAIGEYISSHIEFGSCLADYPGLKKRYRRIRELEDVDEYSRKRDALGRPLRRIRFVNYYTASTGFIKSNSPGGCRQDVSPRSESRERSCKSDTDTVTDQATSRSPSPLICVGGSPGDGMNQSRHQSAMESVKRSENDPPKTPDIPLAESLPALPPLPDLRGEPAKLDHSQFADKDTLKPAQKDHSRQVKAYEREKEDHERAIKDRQELLEKRQEAAAEEMHQQQQEAVTPIPPPLPPRNTPSTTTVNEQQTNSREATPDPSLRTSTPSRPSTPRRKERKFCALPPKDPSGARDPLWVKVYMESMDEVMAHQSMFIPNDTYYEKLVGDTAELIQRWVQEDQSRRVILAETKLVD
ncbi:hypothetical protein M432DRAFT_538820 [Thermoascus aurantiacus ATCC 26904]